MNESLKAYHVKIKTVGPVFVGNGKKYHKKEYAFFSRKEIGIFDIVKLYGFMKRKGIWKQFEEYYAGNDRRDLGEWLKDFRINLDDVRSCVKYMLDSGDTVYQKKTELLPCVKDAYGLAYIPGSTIKGMFRTILLADDIMEGRQDYDKVVRSIDSELFSATKKRNVYLKREISEIEQMTYNTLDRNEKKMSDAVNDSLSGLIISDSHPVKTENLVLCQKIDRHVDGGESSMPLLRESIKPDTEIEFDLTIDTSLCKVSVEQLRKAIENFNRCYDECFLSAFGEEKLKPDNIFIGGGTGFVSKTVLYPLYGKKKGTDAAKDIFRNTGVPAVHKHNLDTRYGVSPHILKYTKYRGKSLQMGLCRLEAIEEL